MSVSNQLQDAGSQGPAPNRAEVVQRLLAHGFAALDEYETLALMLSRSSRSDPWTPAAALLGRFGCLPRVLGATLPELRQAVRNDVALDVCLFAEVMQRALEFRVRRRPLLGSCAAVHDYLRAALAGRSREQFRVLFLDKANQLIADELMGDGTVDHAPVYPREVMRRALELGASACILAHNHPTGAATPSSADIEVTRQVVAAGRALGVAVHDHLLVAGDAVVSFKGQGLM